VAASSSPSAFLYLLRCRDGSLYCGWSVDLDRRLAAHAAGTASRYTASRRPVALAAAWATETRTQARRLEAQVKLLTRPEKLRLVAGEPLAGTVRLAPRDDAGQPPVSPPGAGR
jgi:putative endonuclease